MPVIKRANADPTHASDEGDIDVYEETVSTDGSGNGSTTVTWAEEFDATPTIASVDVTDDGGDAYVSSSGTSQCTVQVDGSTADVDVTVAVTVVGPR